MKYKNINFFDKNIYRKDDIIKKNLQYLEGTDIPLPSEVEISDSGTCNRKCSFCPRSDPNYKDIKEFITSELHEKICRQLSEVNYKDIVIHYYTYIIRMCIYSMLIQYPQHPEHVLWLVFWFEHPQHVLWLEQPQHVLLFRQ